MVSFEQEFRTFLGRHAIAFADHCDAYTQLDFTLLQFHGNKAFHIDVKEKRQTINCRNWPSVPVSEEAHKFIIDDLAARKTLAYAPYSGLLVRNNLQQTYHWFSVLDLALMPKLRVNRTIEKKNLTYKGKWIIDLRNGQCCATLADVLQAMRHYATHVLQLSTSFLPCFGTYIGETIGIEGEKRKPGHWNTDISATR